MDLTKVRIAFAEYFDHWGIILPEDVGTKGEIHKAGWFINYAITEEGFEFRCGHRMTNERYHVVDEEGVIREGRPFPCEGYFYGPHATPEEKEASRAAMIEHNRLVHENYRSKGLLSADGY